MNAPPALDADQVRELHSQWNAWGCAICGQTASDDAPPGLQIELHHVHGRPSAGEGGPWAIDPYSDIVGLCGELLPGRCHWRVTTHALELRQGAWLDTSTGETGPLRLLPWPNGTLVAGAEPEARFAWLRETIGSTRRQMILVALELARAYADADYQRLGVDWPMYYSNLGLSKSQVSKMLRVAHAFGTRPLELAGEEQPPMERLYLGARLVDQGSDPEDALAAAVHHPTEQMIALVRGDEPADRHPCTCPQCGREVWHSPAGGVP